MLKEKTLWFSFDVIHVPGKKHCGPDYMSRQGQYDAKLQREVKKEARLNLLRGFAMNAEDETTDSIDPGLLAVGGLLTETGSSSGCSNRLPSHTLLGSHRPLGKLTLTHLLAMVMRAIRTPHLRFIMLL